MKNITMAILLPLAAAAATAIPTDPARACDRAALAGEPAAVADEAPARPGLLATLLEKARDFTLRRPTLRAF